MSSGEKLEEFCVVSSVWLEPLATVRRGRSRCVGFSPTGGGVTVCVRLGISKFFLCM